MTDHPPTYGSPTPWGRVQQLSMIADGIWQVSTASHGGIWLSPDRLAQVRFDWAAYAESWAHGWGPGWFEEDVAACAVVATWPSLFAQLGADWQAVQAEAESILARYIKPRKVAQ